jgi:hypothetical protein
MIPFSKKCFFALCFLSLSFLSQAQTVRYVDANHTGGTGFMGSGDGSSWVNPLNNLAFAIYESQNNDTLWVYLVWARYERQINTLDIEKRHPGGLPKSKQLFTANYQIKVSRR